MASANAIPELYGSIDALTQALDVRDPYTRTHCDRVVELAAELGRLCGVDEIGLADLRLAARFHDVGKIGVPDSVLLKPSRLTSAEWTLMKAHSANGERIFKAAHLDGDEEITRAIRHHHESYDGSGYPDGLAGADIPLLSRILLVVDAYDAMASSRPYHPGRSHIMIMEIMNAESESKLDPEVFAHFTALIENSQARAH
jgi:HD-GYP domain-containing protein (c-di-GMP phosphodiesterase class II)